MRSKDPEIFEQIEEYINDCKNNYGTTPTVRQIEAELGISRSTVGRYLSVMREEGTIEYSGHRNIVTKEDKLTQNETVKVPILGNVSCGIPKYAEENIEEYVRLPVSLFGRGDFFLLRANGDSMINANICDGDLVLIRQQSSADEGQIVVALMDDEATLKRFYPEREKHRIRLHPENDELDDIYVTDCIIQGVAVNVIKDVL